MADPTHRDYSPDEIVRARVGVDLKDAVAPPEADLGAEAGKPSAAGPPHPGHDQVADQTRMQQQALPDGRPERDDKLVHIGRGHQTTGRQ